VAAGPFGLNRGYLSSTEGIPEAVREAVVASYPEPRLGIGEKPSP
jgi:hypothetical protein